MGRPIEPHIISAEQRRELERIVNAPSSEQRLVRRARIVLLRADGRSQVETANAVDVNRPVVIRWERSFAKLGLAGWEEAAGRGRKPSIPDAKKEKVLIQATEPPPNRTRWSVRSMGRQVGVSPASVQRI